jgi:serine/threonine-protein kinase ULK4
LEKLIPAIANKIESKSADTRFIALKVFTDYITQFMCDDKIYQPQENTKTTQILNELIMKKFLANYGLIVTDQEPMPLYGLKLLSIILDRN